MGRKKNGTNRIAAKLGLNPYGWGNGGKRKVNKNETPVVAATRESNTRINNYTPLV